MAGEIHRITQETLDKLEAEYLELTTVGRTTIARTIESARLMGDLSENGDYHAAKAVSYTHLDVYKRQA